MVKTGPINGKMEFPSSKRKQMRQFHSRIGPELNVIIETTPCYDNSAGIPSTAKHRRFIFPRNGGEFFHAHFC